MTKKTVCAYCGVGCKFDIISGKLKGDRHYPVNKGMSCAKGMSQTESMQTNRLLEVQKREQSDEPFLTTTYEDAIAVIADKIQKTDPQRVGFYLSGQMLNEDYYVANKLAKGFVGTPHCDTNSRTCMASAVVGYKKSFGVDYVPVRIEDIDSADTLMLTGANPAESHVVLFNRIKKAQKKGLKVIVIDPRETATAKIADLYLPIHAGRDIELLNLLAKRLIEEGAIDATFIQKHASGFETYKADLLRLDDASLLEKTGLSTEKFEMLVTMWKESRKTITAWTMGLNQSSQGVEKNLAVNNLHIITGKINKQGCGPFSLTGQPNAMGGREVGGLSTTLAAHMDYTPENCKRVSAFWNSNCLPSKPGLTAFEMIEAADNHALDILIICHTDPVYHLPDRHFVEKAMKNISLVVEINAYKGSETSSFSHIRIPALPFGYKEGTQTNMDRTLTRVVPFAPKGELLQDWEIFSKLGRALGYEQAFDFTTTKTVFEEYQAMTKLSPNRHLNIYEADYDLLANKPFVWGETLFKDNRFMTDDGRVRVYSVTNLERSEQPDQSYPFLLLTGRTRDQWHSGSKTAQVKSLLKHKPLTFIEINPDDAKTLGLTEEDEVIIFSKRGKLTAKVKYANINPKTVFIPLSHKDVNYLTPGILDPQSKEPDYNHTAVRIEKV